jgi:hypothetical protein
MSCSRSDLDTAGVARVRADLSRPRHWPAHQAIARRAGDRGKPAAGRGGPRRLNEGALHSECSAFQPCPNRAREHLGAHSGFRAPPALSQGGAGVDPECHVPPADRRPAPGRTGPGRHGREQREPRGRTARPTREAGQSSPNVRLQESDVHHPDARGRSGSPMGRLPAPVPTARYDPRARHGARRRGTTRERGTGPESAARTLERGTGPESAARALERGTGRRARHGP